MEEAEKSEIMKAIVDEIRSRASPDMSPAEQCAIDLLAEIAPASIAGLNAMTDKNPGARDCIVALAIAFAETYVNSVRIVCAMYGATPTEENVEAIKDAMKMAVEDHINSISMTVPIEHSIQ